MASTIDNNQPSDQLDAFRAFYAAELDQIAKTLFVAIQPYAPDIGLLNDEELRQRIFFFLHAFRTSMHDPQQLREDIENQVGPYIKRRADLVSVARMLRLLRREFIALSIRALAANTPYATQGLEALMALIDDFNLTVIKLYQNQQDEGMTRQSYELRTTRDRLEQALRNSPLATTEWGLDGTILSWNASAARIFGWSAEEMIGQNITELVPEWLREQAKAGIALLQDNYDSDNSNAQEKTPNVTKDGRNIICHWYTSVLRDDKGRAMSALSQAEDITESLRNEEERAALQQQVIEAQAAALRELSTPLIPLADGVVAMPLIGSIDSTRAQQVIEELLVGVSSNNATIAILDITGVPVVDTQVANALLQAAQAVKLLGAQVVLTGIRPEVAQILVSLGIDFRGIVTLSTLQSGIAYALKHGTTMHHQ